ncbi:glycosyl hydrolase [Aspergillus crustosus]
MSATFTNPVLWEDLPDPEVLRVGETYYMSASSFHFSPGAPVLQTSDLINWSYIRHSVPSLPPHSRFSLDGKRPTAYGKGVWACTIKYRESNRLFYFYTAIQGTDATYFYTAESPGGVWTAHPPIKRFYYDLRLLVDDDDAIYITYRTKTIEVAQLLADGLREVSNRVSTAGPFGPYKARDVIEGMRSPWYYMAFTNTYPTGRIPVLAPVEFDSKGWPKVITDYATAKGDWLLKYSHPHAPSPSEKHSTSFHRYKNHNPNNSKWTIQDGQLILRTGTVTESLYLNINTLTLRTTGPGSIAIFCIDTSAITDGDRAGISLFRDESAYIRIHKTSETLNLIYVDGAEVGPINIPVGWLNGRPVALDWECISNSSVKAQTPLTAQKVWLQTKVNLRAAHWGRHENKARNTTFEYSYDGSKFKQLSPVYELTKSTAGYVGYHFGLFIFATVALGGEIRVGHVNLKAWEPTG